MYQIVRIFMICVALGAAPMAIASPQEDAQYIAERPLTPETVASFDDFFREQFVKIYSGPLAGMDIEIADHEKFMSMIPEEDLSAIAQRFHQDIVHEYLTIYTPEQLASLASIIQDYPTVDIESLSGLRLDQDNYEQVVLDAMYPGFDEAPDSALSALIARLDAYDALPRSDAANGLSRDFSLGWKRYGLAVEYGQELRSTTRTLDHPLFLELVQTDGLLQFSNPILRQSFERRLAVSDVSSGIQFIAPPN